MSTVKLISGHILCALIRYMILTVYARLGRTLCFAEMVFSINNERAMIFDITQVYDYTPCIYNPAEIEQVKKKVKILKTLSQEFLLNRNNNSDIDTFISNKFSEFMERAIKFYKSDVIPPALPPGADELIGLGRGLTPSGDDLLAGFMTAMVFLILYIAKKCAARLEANPSPIDVFTTTFLNFVYENSSRTHAISKQMLKTAALGEGPKVMTDLMENIFSEHMEQSRLEQNLRKLLSTGSTSGADMAQGIYTAFTAILY